MSDILLLLVFDAQALELSNREDESRLVATCGWQRNATIVLC